MSRIVVPRRWLILPNRRDQAGFIINPFRFGGGAGGSGLAAKILARSPWGYWKLDETVFTNPASDASGNGRNGTYQVTGSLATAAGLYGGSSASVLFSGGRTELPSFTMATNQKLSIVAHLKTTFSSATPASILSADDSASNRRWQFRMTSGKVEFVTISPAVTTTTLNSPLINDGNSHQVALVFDPTLAAGSGVVKIYLDGSLGVQSSTAITISSGTAGPVIAGRQFGSTANGWAGNLDDCALFLGALTSADVADIWAARNTL